MPRENIIQILHGLEADLPAGGTYEGELRYTDDTKKLFIDDGVSNILIASNEVMTDMNNVVRNAILLKQNTFTGISELTPIYANDISIDYISRVLTITPSLGYFDFFVNSGGVSYTFRKTGSVSFNPFSNTTGFWYFYFDINGTATVSQSLPANKESYAYIYRVYWDSVYGSTVGETFEASTASSHSIDKLWKEQKGTTWISGFDITNNKLSSGSPSADGANTVIGMTGGSMINGNIVYTITNGTGSNKFEQNLGTTSSAALNATNSALMNIGQVSPTGITILPATRFPFKWNPATNRPQYINTAGVVTDVSNGYFFVYYVYTLNDPRNGETFKLFSAETEFSSSISAQAHSWNSLQNYFPITKDKSIRPHYKLIFEFKTSYDVGCKYSVLREIADLRQADVITTTVASGSLPASSISYIPNGNISATNIQLAITELDAEKVSKVSSLDNAIARFNGITGDIQNSLVYISDNGSVDIPTGQNFTINAIPLKDVSETLTNKTLTAPILNAEITGTGITTTGEANKLIKANSTGSIGINGSVNDVIALSVTAGTKVYPFRVFQNTTNVMVGASTTAGRFGTVDAKDIEFLTSENRKAKIIDTTGNFLIGTTITDDTSNKLQVEGSIRLGTGILSKTLHPNDGVKKVLGSWTALTTDNSWVNSGASIEAYSNYLSQGGIEFKVSNGGARSTALDITYDKGVRLPGLAGTGNRMVTVDTNGNLSTGDITPINGSFGMSITNLTSYSTDGRIIQTYWNSANGNYKFGGIFANTYRDVVNPSFTAGMWFDTTTAGGIHSSTDIVFGCNVDGNSTALPVEGLRVVANGTYGTPPVIKIASLAGAARRAVTTDSNGNLSAVYNSDIYVSIPLLTTPTSTGISINGGSSGKTVMLYFSSQWAAGDATFSGVYMMRCGYDGNNYTIVTIAENGVATYKPIFSQVGGILYVMTAEASGVCIRAVENR